MTHPLQYAKAFPKLLGHLLALSQDPAFLSLQTPYLQKVEEIAQGLTDEVVSSQEKALQAERPQTNLLSWLRIKSKSHALNLDIPPRFCLFGDLPLKVGRHELLQDIRNRLQPLHTLGDIKRVILVGLGGMGKSHLAAWYALDHATRYTFGGALNGATLDTYSQGLRKLGDALVLDLPEKNEEVRAYLKAYLELPSQTGWLLVLDNVDTPPTIKPHLPIRGGIF